MKRHHAESYAARFWRVAYHRAMQQLREGIAALEASDLATRSLLDLAERNGDTLEAANRTAAASVYDYERSVATNGVYLKALVEVLRVVPMQSQAWLAAFEALKAGDYPDSPPPPSDLQ